MPGLNGPESKQKAIAPSAQAQDIGCTGEKGQPNRREAIREVMKQGYLAMARINLAIASELFLLEQEAGGTVDRLVSGV